MDTPEEIWERIETYDEGTPAIRIECLEDMERELTISKGGEDLAKSCPELEKATRRTHGVCGHLFRMEDILVQKSRTCCD
jgi:hypothetical protein